MLSNKSLLACLFPFCSPETRDIKNNVGNILRRSLGVPATGSDDFSSIDMSGGSMKSFAEKSFSTPTSANLGDATAASAVVTTTPLTAIDLSEAMRKQKEEFKILMNEMFGAHNKKVKTLFKKADKKDKQRHKKLVLKLDNIVKEVNAFIESQEFKEKENAIFQEMLKGTAAREEALAKKIETLQEQILAQTQPVQEMYEKYQLKLATLKAQQDLLSRSLAVRKFYITLHKKLEARIKSALLALEEKLAREKTKKDTVTTVAATAAGACVEVLPIPVISSLLSGFVSLAVEEGMGKRNNKSRVKKDEAVSDAFISFKEIEKITELVARRMTENYRNYIDQNVFEAEECEKAAKKITRIIFNYLKTNQLDKLATVPLEEKVQAIVVFTQATVDRINAKGKKPVFKHAKKTTKFFHYENKKNKENKENKAKKVVATNIVATSTTSQLQVKMKSQQNEVQIESVVQTTNTTLTIKQVTIEQVQQENFYLKQRVASATQKLEFIKSIIGPGPGSRTISSFSSTTISNSSTLSLFSTNEQAAAMAAFTDRVGEDWLQQGHVEISYMGTGTQLDIRTKNSTDNGRLLTLSDALEYVFGPTMFKQRNYIYESQSPNMTVQLEMQTPDQAQQLQKFIVAAVNVARSGVGMHSHSRKAIMN